MAGLTKQKSGWWVQFRHKRRAKTMRLGTDDDTRAQEAKLHIESLIRCEENGDPLPRTTEFWLGTLPAKWTSWLERNGLVAAKRPFTPTVGGLCDFARKEYQGSKPNTVRTMETIFRRIEGHFGRHRNLASITRGDVKSWKRDLEREGISDAYISKILKKSTTVWNIATDYKMLSENPFHKVERPSESNKDREYFVTREVLDDILEECDDVYRAIIVLARIGGLRCPSEIVELKWEYVNRNKKRLMIYSPKNERFPKKRFRVIPLWPLIEDSLDRLFAKAPKMEPYIFPQFRSTKDSRTIYNGIKRRIIAAGVVPWGRLVHNLRSSRETELIESGHDIHVVTAWMGNSIRIAQKHYLQIRDEAFDKSIESEPSSSLLKT